MLPEYLYHGTSDFYLDQILRDGLDPRSSADAYLCYSDDPEIAIHHARCMAHWDAGRNKAVCEPILFKIPIRRFDETAFCLDCNFIDLGPSAGRAVASDIRGQELEWRELLELAGAVGYRAVLDVSENDFIHIGSVKPHPAATI
ncbi:hypothetical protein G6L37_06280 [Agrobacterium rubi]|nr:hypothetical protein [Agrobacterium rubi]NTF24969.1 hypothetical protein [Agrobacterium rubi]